MADGRGCWSCLGWRWPRPPPGAGAAADPPAERAPLVLCPGVCGTQLGVRPAGTTGDGERCWVTLASSDVNYKRLRGRYSAETGRVELLTPGFEVAIPQGQDASGLYAISVLDPDLALPAVHYFEPLIAFLQGQGYAPGVDLFGAGYDFRQSCRFNACALLARLQEVSRRCGGRRVDIVTHSMGGLVVRSLLADFPAEFEALVGRWVAIGCPFGGAPGYTVDALLTGVQFGGSLGDYFFVQRGTFLQACLQSPAIYELLPPLDFPFAHPPPQLTLWLKEPIPPPPQGQQAGGAGAGEAAGAPLPCVAHQQVTVNPQAAAAAAAAAVQGTAELAAGSSGAGTTTTTNSAALASSGGLLTAQQYVFRHEHLPGLLARLFRDNAVAVGGASVALPFNQELWALGQATHASWAAARLPRSCRFFNVLGTGTSTPYDAQYGAWWYPLQNLEGVPHANADFTYVDGDGTVPAESSAAHGLGAAGSAAVGASHRGLAVFALLLQWLQEPLTERGPREERATPSAAAPAADGLRAPLLGDGQEGAAAVPGEDLSNPLVWWALMA